MRIEQAFATIRFAPLLPSWLLAALAALCVLVLVPAFWRRARGAASRALAFAVLLLWLAGPRAVEETRQTLPDIGLLVVDQTASMQVGNRTALAEQARQSVEAQAARLPDLELRTITVPESGSEGTRLFTAVDRALAEIPRSRLAGVVAITDGQVHDIPADPPGGAPLNVLIPAAGEETDRRLRVIEAPGYGIVGQSVTLRVAIEDLGVDLGVPGSGASARLTMRRDGEPPVTETVPVGPEHSITLPITRAGPSVVELQAEPLPGEVSQLNNRAVVTVNGVRDRLRVLLVSGEPHAGERTWRRLLKADPAVDLVHFTILRPPEKDDLTPLNELALIAFPVRELFQVKIKEFDLIILDRFQNRGILPSLYLRNIADYVRGGGALLMSVGPEFSGPTSLAASPLGEILPARPTAEGDTGSGVASGPYRPEVTPLGTRHPVTEDLPGWRANWPPSWGDWYRYETVGEVQGQVVMDVPNAPSGSQGGGQPLLVLDHVGEGRVALLLSDQIWLWSRGHEGGGPQAELLRRTAHWLMKEPQLEENALTAQVENGRLSIVRRSTDPAPPGPVTVIDPDGGRRAVALHADGPIPEGAGPEVVGPGGRQVADLPAGTPGVWQVSDGTRIAYAAAGAANPLEIADLRATATRLEPLARKSRGGIHWLSHALTVRRTEPEQAASGGDWIGLRRNHDHLVTGIAALPLLPPWLALPLMLGLMVLAWRREAD